MRYIGIAISDNYAQFIQGLSTVAAIKGHQALASEMQDGSSSNYTTASLMPDFLSTPVRRQGSQDPNKSLTTTNEEEQSKMIDCHDNKVMDVPLSPKGGSRVRTLTLIQLLLLNAVVCGLEFCASAAFTYIPPMLLKAGLDEEHMSIVIGIGPLLGFFLVPVIGRSSDHCQNQYGRRRPFILGLGILLIISLIVLPYGSNFVGHLLGQETVTRTTRICILIIGAVLLDFTSQACLTPCEALLADATRNTNQQERCFTVYSFMVSAGGCVGYLITALDWGQGPIGIYFGGQEKSVFSMLVFLFTATLFCTLGVADEQPLEEIALEEEDEKEDNIPPPDIQKRLDEVQRAMLQESESLELMLGIPTADPGYESSGNRSDSEEYPINSIKPAVSYSRQSFRSFIRIPKILKQCNIPLTRWTFTTLEGLFHFIRLRVYAILPETLQTLLNVPFVLKRLALANFCSWTAVMGFNLFFTDFVGQAVYAGNPNADDNSPEEALYDLGVRMGSIGLLLHCITSAISAPLIEKLVPRFGHVRIYFFGLASFSLAMLLMVCFRTIYIVNLMAACTGFAYATMTTIPFMLINIYHDNKQLFFYDLRAPNGPTVKRGIASDMAIVDSAYFLSQVILSMFMGYIVTYLGSVVGYVITAGTMGVIACICISRIVPSEQTMKAFIKSNRVRPLVTSNPTI